MKVHTFFKILNKKIEKYDKLASNPFTISRPIIIVWVEDVFEKETQNNKNKD